MNITAAHGFPRRVVPARIQRSNGPNIDRKKQNEKENENDESFTKDFINSQRF